VEETYAPDRSFVLRRAKAWQEEADRLVWLKETRLFRTTPAAIQARDSLRYEGRLLAQFKRQPDFPSLLDIEEGDEAVAIVFSFSSGPALEQAFGPLNQPMDAGQAYRLLRSLHPLCRMLRTLHRQDLAHRYLTPETIILLEERRNHAVLRDLGLAAQPRTSDEGPPLYRAPEQTRERGLSLPGPHTDIYQLGAVLYHLLTGRTPTSFLSEIEPPSIWNRSFPVELDRALIRARAKSPGDRWSTLQDFCLALDRAAELLVSQLRGEE